MFGNLSLDIVINKLFIQGKQHIYYCKMKKLRPDLAKFLNYFKTCYAIEEYTAKQTFMLNKFEHIWKKYINITNQ